MDTVEGDATTEGTAKHGTSSLTEGHQELGTVQKSRNMALNAL